MIKRISAIIMVISLALSLESCGGTVNPSSSEAISSENLADSSLTDSSSASALKYHDYALSDQYSAVDNAEAYTGAEAWNTNVITLSCSLSDNSTWTQAAYYFNALMSESSQGNVTVNVVANDELTDGSDVLGVQALIDGTSVQMSMQSSLAYGNFDARYNVTALPYLFADYTAADNCLNGTGGDAIKALCNEHNLTCLGIGENGFTILTNSKHAVSSLSDMADLNIRTISNDLINSMYTKLGCMTTTMQWDEIYNGLADDVVDGQISTVTAAEDAGIMDEQGFVTMLNLYYDSMLFCVNSNFYNAFTDVQKAVIESNANKAIEYQKALNRANTQSITDEWNASTDIEVIASDAVKTKKLKKAVSGMQDEYKQTLIDSGMSEKECDLYLTNFIA